MKRQMCVMVAMVMGCHSGGNSSIAPDADISRTLLALEQGSLDAWNRGDINGHVALYTDSATMMFKAGPKGGREFIKSSLARNFWKDGKPLQQLAFEDLAVTPLGRDHAMMTGKFILKGNGVQKEATGRFTLVWTRTPLGWQIIHDHSS